MTKNNPPLQPVSLTIEQSLDQAIAYHQAGQLLEAAPLYRTVLQVQPDHPEANYNLGLLAVQIQQPAAGLPHLKVALEADPNQRRYWLSYIDALIQADQADAARQVLEQGRQLGLNGEEVDALAVRSDNTVQTNTSLPVSSAITHQETNPNAHEINTLIALFNEGRYPEVATLAQTMTLRFPLYGFGWIVLGAAFKQMGRSADALAPMQKAAALSPDDVDAHNNLGVTLQDLGRLVEAEACCRRALQIKPDHAEGHNNLGNILEEMNRPGEAEVCYRQALAINPNYAKAHNNLGNTLRKLGRPGEAEMSYRRALAIKPDYAEAYNNLGGILQDLGSLNDAEQTYRQAIQITPNFAEAHYNLGNILQKQNRLTEAEASYLRAIRIAPNFAEAHYNLGNIYHELGRLNEAETHYRSTLELNPDFPEAHYSMGTTLSDLTRQEEAEISYRRALELKPDFAEAHSSLGITLMTMGRLDEAEVCYRRALQIKPDYAHGHNNLGDFLKSCGQLDAAVACFRQALAIKPDYVEAHSNLIFTLDLMAGKHPSSLQEERARWNAAHTVHLHQQPAHANIPDPERRIRIGYVSADFRGHSASKAFGGMLLHFDRSQFEVFAYSNFKGKVDEYTALFKQSVTAWRNIVGLSDDAVAQMINEDRIDILVDLSGHSAGNRLLVFARKPAPIQITAWGYSAGTGMQAIDVFFTDPIMVPPEDQHYFTEKVRYLPNAVGTFFIDPFPDVNELPALTDGIVTFGSLNRLAKVSEDAYSAWAQILLAVPRSRLILKTAELDDASTRERIAEHFTKAGVTADRITLQGKTPWQEHIQTYHQIDIGLDPFPQGGGITALEGLMMGVPIINLHGASLPGRLSASIMTTIGLTDWIEKTREKYVELAIRKATDLQSLAALRQQLRGIFTSSVIGNQAAYARAVEQEYRQLWQKWCEK